MRSVTIIMVLCWLLFAACWIGNLAKLIRCDFASPYKSEVVHAVGVFVPPAALVTVWFD